MIWKIHNRIIMAISTLADPIIIFFHFVKSSLTEIKLKILKLTSLNENLYFPRFNPKIINFNSMKNITHKKGIEKFTQTHLWLRTLNFHLISFSSLFTLYNELWDFASSYPLTKWMRSVFIVDSYVSHRFASSVSISVLILFCVWYTLAVRLWGGIVYGI